MAQYHDARVRLEAVGRIDAMGEAERLRREAIEACLCSAQFHMDPLQHADAGVFVDGAIDLAWQAVTKVVDRTLWKFRDPSVEGRAAEWEDAAKLLLSGWSP